MAKRTRSIREARAEAEAAEKVQTKKKSTTKSTTTRRRKAAEPAGETRLKAFWGVFNQSMSLQARFDYADQASANKKAEELTESKKSPHFVQLIKQMIEE